MLLTMASKKKYKKIILLIASSLTILASLSIIFIAFKYNLVGFSDYGKIKNSQNLVSLYAKSQHSNEPNFTSKIAIKNGCGKKYLGLIYKRYLLDLGYDVTEAANATHPNGELNFGHSATKILFHKENKDAAIYLSNELGIDKKQIFKDNNNSFHDLTLILGQNHIKLKSYKTAETFNPFHND